MDENEQEFIGQNYPFPDGPDVVKVDGKEMEYLILVKKGAEAEQSDGKSDKNEKDQGKEKDEKKDSPPAPPEAPMKVQDTEMSEDLTELKEQNEILTQQLSEIKTALKKEKVVELVDARIQKSLSEEDEKDAEVEKLMALSEDQIAVLKEDVVKLSVPGVGKPQGQVKGDEADEKVQLSDAEQQKKDIRMKLFGHEDVLPRGGKA